MIVEFTGCTASGKTTLVAKVIERLSNHGPETITPVEFLMRPFGLKPSFYSSWLV